MWLNISNEQEYACVIRKSSAMGRSSCSNTYTHAQAHSLHSRWLLIRPVSHRYERLCIINQWDKWDCQREDLPLANWLHLWHVVQDKMFSHLHHFPCIASDVQKITNRKDCKGDMPKCAKLSSNLQNSD